MERSKIKNVIILILLAVNIALGCLLLQDVLAERQATRKAMEDLRTVLTAQNIALETEDLTLGQELYVLRAYRDTDREDSVAGRLLGEYTVEEQGGNIHRCLSDAGEITFRGNGDLQAVFHGVRLDTVLRVLAEYGADFAVPPGGSGTYTAVQTLEGCRLPENEVMLTVENGVPTALTGRLLVSPTAEDADALHLDAYTAVMRLAAANREQALGITALREAETIYFMIARVTGEFELEPLWLLRTDVGDFTVSGVTGAVEPLRIAAG